MLKNDLNPTKYPIIYDNKLGIKDLETLLDCENRACQAREYEIREKGLFVNGKFDLAHLQSIHRHLFQDVYPWAGEVRDVNISKGGTLFCYCPYIENAMNDLSNKIKSFDKKSNVKEIANHLAYVSNELNAIHPFREGNGRSKRVFLDRYALSMGYELNLQNIPAEELKQLEISTYKTDDLNPFANRLLVVMQKNQKQTISPQLQEMQARAKKQKLQQKGQVDQKAKIKQNNGNFMG